MAIIGLDIGYGYTKVAFVSGRGELEVQTFPSAVGTLEEVLGGAEVLRRPDLDLTQVEGENYLVGESALRHGSRLLQPRERDWIGSRAYQALARFGLSQVPRASVLVTGLPVRFLADKGRLERIIRLAVYDHRGAALDRLSVRVIPQPLGSFFDMLLDGRGEVTREELAEQRVGVLDIGFHTTDLITVDRLELVGRQCLSVEVGVASSLEAIARDLYAAYQLELTPQQAAEAVRTGVIRVRGVRRDIGSSAKKRLEELALELEGRTKTVWKAAADIDQLLFTGGGCVLLKEFLRFYPHATVLNEAQSANARGYYKLGVRLAREG